MKRRNAGTEFLPLFDAHDRGAISAESPPASTSVTGDRVDETQAKHAVNVGSVTVSGVDDANRAFLEAADDMEE